MTSIVSFSVTAATGTSPPPPPSAPAPTRIFELRTSKDGGHNFGYWRQYDMGTQGKFDNQPLFRRLGLGRRIVTHVRISDDCNRDLVACSIDTEPF